MDSSDWTLHLTPTPSRSQGTGPKRTRSWLAVFRGQPHAWAALGVAVLTACATVLLTGPWNQAAPQETVERAESPALEQPHPPDTIAPAATSPADRTSRTLNPNGTPAAVAKVKPESAPAQAAAAPLRPQDLLRAHGLTLIHLAYAGLSSEPTEAIDFTVVARHGGGWKTFKSAMGKTLEVTGLEASADAAHLTISARTPAAAWSAPFTGGRAEPNFDASTTALDDVLLEHAGVLHLTSGDADEAGLSVSGAGARQEVTALIEAVHRHPSYGWSEWTLEPTEHHTELAFTGRLVAAVDAPRVRLNLSTLAWLAPPSDRPDEALQPDTESPYRVKAWADGRHPTLLMVDTRHDQTVLAVASIAAQPGDAVIRELHSNHALVEHEGVSFRLRLP